MIPSQPPRLTLSPLECSSAGLHRVASGRSRFAYAQEGRAVHMDRLSSVLWLCAHAVATCVILVCYSSWVWPRHQLGYAELQDTARLEPSSTSPGRVIGNALGASNTFSQHWSRHQIYAYKILTPPVAQKRLRGFSRARGEPATHSPRLSTTFGAYLCIGSISLAVVVELDVAHPGRGRKRGGPDLR